MKWIVIAVVVAACLLAWRAAVASGGVLKPGDAAPSFSLPDQNGGTRSLGDFRDRWLVLYFYPKDDTPGCTAQACAFRDDWHSLAALGAEVVGVSTDDVTRHIAFAQKYGLPFPLLADTAADVATRYGSICNLGLFRLAKRNTFLIDPQGRIAKVYRSASTSRNASEVIADIQKLQKQ